MLLQSGANSPNRFTSGLRRKQSKPIHIRTPVQTVETDSHPGSGETRETRPARSRKEISIGTPYENIDSERREDDQRFWNEPRSSFVERGNRAGSTEELKVADNCFATDYRTVYVVMCQ